MKNKRRTSFDVWTQTEIGALPVRTSQNFESAAQKTSGDPERHSGEGRLSFHEKNGVRNRPRVIKKESKNLDIFDVLAVKGSFSREFDT